jgi:hypothetical protein
MKSAIANALNQKLNPSSKYKEEYIVTMSPEIRSFLNCTATVFHLPAIGSVESARDQIRIKMKGLSFPIWCLKYILREEGIKCPKADIEKIIDDYCGIANTANGSTASESELAEKIGKLVINNHTIVEDLTSLVDSDKCRKGMLAYINEYKDGLLYKLAAKIGDGGNYIDEVKAKFSAGDANWVWNTSTADERINVWVKSYAPH